MGSGTRREQSDGGGQKGFNSCSIEFGAYLGGHFDVPWPFEVVHPSLMSVLQVFGHGNS